MELKTLVWILIVWNFLLLVWAIKAHHRIVVLVRTLEHLLSEVSLSFKEFKEKEQDE